MGPKIARLSAAQLVMPIVPARTHILRSAVHDRVSHADSLASGTNLVHTGRMLLCSESIRIRAEVTAPSFGDASPMMLVVVRIRQASMAGVISYYCDDCSVNADTESQY